MDMSHLNITLVYFVAKTIGMVTPYMANIKT